MRCGAVAAGFVLYVLGHGVMASSAARGGPERSPTAQVEQALRETALALAGPGLVEDQLASLDRRPELLLLQEVTEGIEP